ncbi:MAG: hypothetical protein Q4F97_01935 [Bacteroidales bacterium]|nr:hypothetical protein [Bacteroidales bacterium]
MRYFKQILFVLFILIDINFILSCQNEDTPENKPKPIEEWTYNEAFVTDVTSHISTSFDKVYSINRPINEDSYENSPLIGVAYKHIKSCDEHWLYITYPYKYDSVKKTIFCLDKNFNLVSFANERKSYTFENTNTGFRVLEYGDELTEHTFNKNTIITTQGDNSKRVVAVVANFMNSATSLFEDWEQRGMKQLENIENNKNFDTYGNLIKDEIYYYTASEDSVPSMVASYHAMNNNKRKILFGLNCIKSCSMSNNQIITDGNIYDKDNSIMCFLCEIPESNTFSVNDNSGLTDIDAAQRWNSELKFNHHLEPNTGRYCLVPVLITSQDATKLQNDGHIDSERCYFCEQPYYVDTDPQIISISSQDDAPYDCDSRSILPWIECTINVTPRVHIGNNTTIEVKTNTLGVPDWCEISMNEVFFNDRVEGSTHYVHSVTSISKKNIILDYESYTAIAEAEVRLRIQDYDKYPYKIYYSLPIATKFVYNRRPFIKYSNLSFGQELNEAGEMVNMVGYTLQINGALWYDENSLTIHWDSFEGEGHRIGDTTIEEKQCYDRLYPASIKAQKEFYTFTIKDKQYHSSNSLLFYWDNGETGNNRLLNVSLGE